MTTKEHVQKHFPDARIEDRGLLYHVMVSKNGLGFEEDISSDITEERAWDEASDWILNYWDCDCEYDNEIEK
jgi:hypothetical protein